MQGYEDVTLYTLTEERERELLEKQIECNFIWTNKEGHGMGVIMILEIRLFTPYAHETRQETRTRLQIACHALSKLCIE